MIITGISRGLGKAIAQAVLIRGDVVIGTSRSGTADFGGEINNLHVTQAALPLLREQRSGHIVNITSIAGIAPAAGSGFYAAAKGCSWRLPEPAQLPGSVFFGNLVSQLCLRSTLFCSSYTARFL